MLRRDPAASLKSRIELGHLCGRNKRSDWLLLPPCHESTASSSSHWCQEGTQGEDAQDAQEVDMDGFEALIAYENYTEASIRYILVSIPLEIATREPNHQLFECHARLEKGCVDYGSGCRFCIPGYICRKHRRRRARWLRREPRSQENRLTHALRSESHTFVSRGWDKLACDALFWEFSKREIFL